MRVLVCGGRNYDERDLVWHTRSINIKKITGR